MERTELAQNDSLPKYRYFLLVDEIAPRIINQSDTENVFKYYYKIINYPILTRRICKIEENWDVDLGTPWENIKPLSKISRILLFEMKECRRCSNVYVLLSSSVLFMTMWNLLGMKMQHTKMCNTLV